MHFWGRSSSCLSICLMKDNHLLETRRVEGSGLEAACGQRIHQMCSRDLAMLQVRGQTRSQGDISGCTGASGTIRTVRQRKATSFPKCNYFLRCFASLLNDWFHSKIFLFLKNIRHHPDHIFIDLLYIYILQHTFLISENANLKWQNYSDKFTKGYWHQSTSSTACLKGADWKPVMWLQ